MGGPRHRVLGGGLWFSAASECRARPLQRAPRRDLLALIGVEPASARMKPLIRLVPGEIHRMACDAAEHELSLTRRYYQRSGLIVMVLTDPGNGETRIQAVNPRH